VVICLERGADLHTAHLMPLPPTVSCSSKIQIGFTFLVRLTCVVLDKGPLSGCMYTKMLLYCVQLIKPVYYVFVTIILNLCICKV